MPQCQNHEQFVQVALGYGWEMYEYGIDSSCIVGGDAPHLALIWLRPLAWDESQMIPIGCVCCTDLNEALLDYSEEFFDVVESRRIRRTMDPGDGILPESSEATAEIPPLAERPTWLKPYNAR